MARVGLKTEVGTNAIGTSLQLQQPINVTAVEHYCQKHHHWTCSAAPIFNPQGTLMGIVVYIRSLSNLP
jgi:transcriptional regulator of acetoin/glycerol metabolism